MRHQGGVKLLCIPVWQGHSLPMLEHAQLGHARQHTCLWLCANNLFQALGSSAQTQQSFCRMVLFVGRAEGGHDSDHHPAHCMC
jgi:hypothetical protein